MMLNPFFQLLLLVLFLISPSSSSPLSDEDRFRELLSLRSSSSDVTVLNDDTFHSLILSSSSRNYELYVLFEDASSSLYRSEFSAVGYSFLQNHLISSQRNHLILASTSISSSPSSARVFNVTTSPSVVYISKDHTISPRVFQLPNPQTLAFVIESDTGIQVGPVYSPPTITTFHMVIISFMVMVASPVLVRLALPPLQDPKVWCGFAIVTYLFAASGGVFCILYQVPLLASSEQWFTPERSWQTASEGLVVAILYALPSSILALITSVLPRMKLSRRSGSCVAIVLAAASFLSFACVYGLRAWKIS